MRYSKFLILGGLGFIGRHVARTLLAQGHTVRVFDRYAPNHHEAARIFNSLNGLEFATGDFTDKDTIYKALIGCDACIHLVTTTLPATSNEDKLYDIQSNLVGTVQLLEAMRNQDIKKMIFLSSGGTVYGNPNYTPIDENHPTNPQSSYGIVKLAIEKYCQLFNHLHGANTIILRLSNPYGPGQSGSGIQGAVPAFTAKALAGQPIEIWGDGNIVRDYIHIDDVSRAIIDATQYRGEETVFNIGNGVGTSLNDIIGFLRETLNKEVKVNYSNARSFDVSTNILDISKAKKELGWLPSIDFKYGINTVIDDFLGMDN
ncbi:MAG TPA: NAD-dependent epimerase/dehydratase family protein [Pseudochrobactrum sp.]|nr:NAD-dependent epimerase/dehydratase family protein [Pseudochrobactrum sp.]